MIDKHNVKKDKQNIDIKKFLWRNTLKEFFLRDRKFLENSISYRISLPEMCVKRLLITVSISDNYLIDK